MTLTPAAAETLLADRITAIAATLRITERSARAYIDQDALEGMADSLVSSFADEAPGVDLLTMPREAGGLPVPAIVGSVFRWRMRYSLSCAFASFPAKMARGFFRFSWRIREPHGCPTGVLLSRLIPIKPEWADTAGSRCWPHSGQSSDQAGLSKRRSSRELSLNWCRHLAAARTVKSARGSITITVM